MNEQGFLTQHQQEWLDFKRELDAMGRSGATTKVGFPSRYRRICQHLALARYRGYGAVVTDALNRLALRGHHQLYRRPPRVWGRLLRYVAVEVPRTVRREWRSVVLAHLLFYGLALGVFLFIQHDPDRVYSFMGPAQVAQLEDMYRVEGGGSPIARESSSDLVMFGFYIRNNISIAFRTFAGGVMFGLGSLFFLGVNGLFVGAAFGHMRQVGLGDVFFPFVIGHSAFELTAIVLSAAAGLRLGFAGLAPGTRRRSVAIRQTASALAPMLYGFFAMLVLAAFLEACWSSMPWGHGWPKLVVGAALWVMVYAWLALGGRHGPRTGGGGPRAC